ncbi:hypothetical protein SEA_ENNEA_8 [Gordonia phage Ennea]|nr:hypothetical protein SEA_ENNEA_8 [Gordonia phage Ennea]
MTRENECGAKDPASPATCTMPKGHGGLGHSDDEVDMYWEEQWSAEKHGWGGTDCV